MFSSQISKIAQKALQSRLQTNLSRRFFATNKPENPSEEAQSTAAEEYLTKRKAEYEKYYDAEGKMPKIKGYATPEGTKKYSERNSAVPKLHFRKPFRDELAISSIGLGSYIGAPDTDDDMKLFNAAVDVVESGGINMLDTAINYRYQKSERAYGAAIRYLRDREANKIGRDELFISSKNGYIPEDADHGIPGQTVIEELIKAGKMTKDDIAGAVHCMHPAFLEDQLNRTLNNLGLETLDLMYLHNAAESQLPLIGYDAFYKRLADAFEFFEEMVEIGKIRSYGMATWICFRAPPTEEKLYLSLQKVVEIAEKVAGTRHNFKYVQVPINLAMPESFAEKWQETELPPSPNAPPKKETTNLFTVARRLHINVVGSASLWQGKMLSLQLPDDSAFRCKAPSAKHLQYIRSIPAAALLSTLVGMKTSAHVKANLEVINVNQMTPDEFMRYIEPKEK